MYALWRMVHGTNHSSTNKFSFAYKAEEVLRDRLFTEFRHPSVTPVKSFSNQVPIEPGHFPVASGQSVDYDRTRNPVWEPFLQPKVARSVRTGLQIEPRTNATRGRGDGCTVQPSSGPSHACERVNLAATFEIRERATTRSDGEGQTKPESELGTRSIVELAGGLHHASTGDEGTENDANGYVNACNIISRGACVRYVR